MSNRTGTQHIIQAEPFRAERYETIAIMAVGTPEEWGPQTFGPTTANMAFVTFHDVTFDLLERLKPAAIVSPVLSNGFDCIDLSQLLSRLDFKGAYRAYTRELPNPKLVEREIAQLCPKLDFEIVTTI